jgi:hypothetical protein
MSNVTHIHERADRAAREVDPMMLAQALDHIARTAARSRSQTRRIRWIERRANTALDGREFLDIENELPKSAGPNTLERNQKRIAYLLNALHRIRELAPAADVMSIVVDALASPGQPDPLVGWRCIERGAETEPASLESGDNVGVPSFTELVKQVVSHG